MKAPQYITTYFNTGRPYTQAGQQIEAVAELLPRDDWFVQGIPDYRITFYDRSRLVLGRFVTGSIRTGADLATATLRAYDRNDYEGASIPDYQSAAARADAWFEQVA